MAVFSRYAKVIENDGTTMTVRSASRGSTRSSIRSSTSRRATSTPRPLCDRLVPPARLRDGKFGVADDLARARNTAVETMVRDGILTSAAGKVTLLDPEHAGRLRRRCRRPRRHVGGTSPPDRDPAAHGLPVAGAFLASAQERPDGASTPNSSRSSRSCCSRSPRRTAGRRTRSHSTPSRPPGPRSCRHRARPSPVHGEQAAFEFEED